MGYMLVSAAVVVTVGRIGDMFGRVRMYNLGFAWFTVGAILLSCVWSTGSTGALELVILRMFQAVGGALLMANSAAIITDAFPSDQLGFALGINMVAAIVGSFLGILVGGLLSQLGWRWVFLANVPIGAFGTVWAYMKLKEIGVRIKARIDWLGNIAFAGGLAMILIGVTYGIKPYGHSLTGWGNPFVLEMIFGGLALLVVFVFIETRVQDPMFRLSLFRIRAFTAGNAGAVPRVDRPGRPAVHADDLVPGHLAAPARLQLRRHPAVGRDLHDPVHARLRGRRAHRPASCRTATAPAPSPPAGCCCRRRCTR